MTFIIALEVLVIFGILTIILGFLAVYLVKPRWPAWWERNICALDPEERKFIHSTLEGTPSVELLTSHGYNT
jgi:hypothetical protein